MTTIGVDALKDRLSHYLELARQGERIVITDSGRSVAVLAPAEESEPCHRVWELVESGVASWSGGKPTGAGLKPRVKGKSASAIVLEDRR